MHELLTLVQSAQGCVCELDGWCTQAAGEPHAPWIMGLSPGPATTVKDQCLMSSCTTGSLKWRPMRRLASNTVFLGFMATWFLAVCRQGAGRRRAGGGYQDVREEGATTLLEVLVLMLLTQAQLPPPDCPPPKLTCITDQALSVCEGHIGWCGAVTLVVGNDLHAVILPHTHATAGQRDSAGTVRRLHTTGKH